MFLMKVLLYPDNSGSNISTISLKIFPLDIFVSLLLCLLLLELTIVFSSREVVSPTVSIFSIKCSVTDRRLSSPRDLPVIALKAVVNRDNNEGTPNGVRINLAEKYDRIEVISQLSKFGIPNSVSSKVLPPTP